ncbi:TPA: hypothetical protein DEG21_05660 [Patescibacteria group bacterium]|nr:hypothetical protein [Candidatus Gracilibacteria bacterium]HBY75305.1 hypothetical protein [Candidatus Gracilibacteria bacterium]
MIFFLSIHIKNEKTKIKTKLNKLPVIENINPFELLKSKPIFLPKNLEISHKLFLRKSNNELKSTLSKNQSR